MYELTNYLYTLKDCEACQKAKQYLKNNKIDYIETLIDNPSVELGTKALFKNQVYAPYLFHPKEGVSIFSGDPIQLLKIKV